MARPRFYTIKDVMEILQLTKGAVYKMIQRGRLKAHRIGRKLMVSESQLQEYLDDCIVDNSGETG